MGSGRCLEREAVRYTDTGEGCMSLRVYNEDDDAR